MKHKKDLRIGTKMEVKRVELKGARNTRDVGQYQTIDGRKVRSKVFFRSGR